MINEYYIQTLETISEETNNDGETTFLIKGRISKNGNDWENCIFIWDGNAL